jgi:hypothetical protein
MRKNLALYLLFLGVHGMAVLPFSVYISTNKHLQDRRYPKANHPRYQSQSRALHQRSTRA